MGCDIHCIVQVNKGEGWETICEGFREREYSVFALLADVRNYGEELNCARPKGLPVEGLEFTAEGRKAWNEIVVPMGFKTWDGELADPMEKGSCYWLGEHSFSHLSAKELVELTQPTRTVRMNGVLYEESYLALPQDTPQCYARALFEDGLVTVSSDVYEQLRSRGEPTQLLNAAFARVLARCWQDPPFKTLTLFGTEVSVSKGFPLYLKQEFEELGISSDFDAGFEDTPGLPAFKHMGEQAGETPNSVGGDEEMQFKSTSENFEREKGTKPNSLAVKPDMNIITQIAVRTSWDAPLKEHLSERWFAFRGFIEKQAANYGDENVRIVFGFDS